MNRMDGKVCLVTGATQGLGAAIAARLAKAGAAAVAITGRSAEKGRAVAAKIAGESAAKTLFIAADLASVDDCRKAVNETHTQFGRIDVLVNAGASTDRGTILDTTPELFDRFVAVNIRGPYFLMQEAIRRMIGDGVEGSILNIGSISGYTGQPFISPYCMTKGALATLTRNTAFSVMKNRIRVNQLDIGWMASDNERALQERSQGPGWEEKANAALPFGRLIDPEEVARAVNFIVSDDAGLMTGAVVDFDQTVRGGTAGMMPVPDTAMSWNG